MVNTKTNTLGIILSGGAGTRVNGVDKGLQTHRGKRLIEHVISSISPQVNSLIICANRNLANYESFNYPVVCDTEQERYEGPLAGITAAIKFIQQDDTYKEIDKILISPCDVPKPPTDLCSRLEACSNPVSVAFDGKRQQNLHILIHRSMWSSLENFFDHGGRAMHQWVSKVDGNRVDFSDKTECFKNLNRIENS